MDSSERRRVLENSLWHLWRLVFARPKSSGLLRLIMVAQGVIAWCKFESSLVLEHVRTFFSRTANLKLCEWIAHALSRGLGAHFRTSPLLGVFFWSPSWPSAFSTLDPVMSSVYRRFQRKHRIHLVSCVTSGGAMSSMYSFAASFTASREHHTNLVCALRVVRSKRSGGLTYCPGKFVLCRSRPFGRAPDIQWIPLVFFCVNMFTNSTDSWRDMSCFDSNFINHATPGESADGV